MKHIAIYTITDMIRGTISVNDRTDMMEAYDYLLKVKELNIVRVTN